MQPFVERNDGGHGRPRALWRLLLQYLIYTVSVSLLANLLVAGWLAIRSGGKTPSSGELDPSSLSGSPALLLIGGVAALAGVLLSVWFAGRFLDRRPFADFGFHLGGGWLLDLLFGMALGALLMTGIFLAELQLGWVSVTGFLQTPGGGSFLPSFLVPLLAFLCVGVQEELLSRGYQLRNAAEGLNYPGLGPRGAVVAAWVLSSIFFGALHAVNPNATLLSTANIALAGLMLGLGYVLTGELAIPIGLHITWNLFQGNVYGFPVSGIGPVGATFVATEQGGPGLWTGGVFGPEAGLLGVLAILAGIILTTLWVRIRRGEVAVHAALAEPPKPPSATVAGARDPAG